jgi:uncharacterized protein YlxW (UPF0749 family)
MSRRPLSAAAVGLLAAVLAFVGTVQLRSQAEVQRTLEAQDPAALAFLIDDLHTANDRLVAEVAALTARRDSLSTGGGAAANQQLSEEETRLRILEGVVPVHGPGVTITVDAPLTPFDLEDAGNNLRLGGAEAVTINDHRIVTSSVYQQSVGAITIDGVATHGPWTFVAVGDPAHLQAAAEVMTRSLKSDPRVRLAAYRFDPDVAIRATVLPRPFVYGSA